MRRLWMAVVFLPFGSAVWAQETPFPRMALEGSPVATGDREVLPGSLADPLAPDPAGLSTFPDHTDPLFRGGHLGAGVELILGARASIDADARSIFWNPDSEQIQDQDFKDWQVTLGLNLYF